MEKYSVSLALLILGLMFVGAVYGSAWLLSLLFGG
jgi:hypothetical protein